jgi:hypothetical protein
MPSDSPSSKPTIFLDTKGFTVAFLVKQTFIGCNYTTFSRNLAPYNQSVVGAVMNTVSGLKPENVVAMRVHRSTTSHRRILSASSGGTGGGLVTNIRYVVESRDPCATFVSMSSQFLASNATGQFTKSLGHSAVLKRAKGLYNVSAVLVSLTNLLPTDAPVPPLPAYCTPQVVIASAPVPFPIAIVGGAGAGLLICCMICCALYFLRTYFKPAKKMSAFEKWTEVYKDKEQVSFRKWTMRRIRASVTRRGSAEQMMSMGDVYSSNGEGDFTLDSPQTAKARRGSGSAGGAARRPSALTGGLDALYGHDLVGQSSPASSLGSIVGSLFQFLSPTPSSPSSPVMLSTDKSSGSGFDPVAMEQGTASKGEMSSNPMLMASNPMRAGKAGSPAISGSSGSSPPTGQSPSGPIRSTPARPISTSSPPSQGNVLQNTLHANLNKDKVSPLARQATISRSGSRTVASPFSEKRSILVSRARPLGAAPHTQSAVQKPAPPRRTSQVAATSTPATARRASLLGTTPNPENPYQKYAQLKKLGVSDDALAKKMLLDGVVSSEEEGRDIAGASFVVDTESSVSPPVRRGSINANGSTRLSGDTPSLSPDAVTAHGATKRASLSKSPLLLSQRTEEGDQPGKDELAPMARDGLAETATIVAPYSGSAAAVNNSIDTTTKDKYIKLQKMGIRRSSIAMKMATDGVAASAEEGAILLESWESTGSSDPPLDEPPSIPLPTSKEPEVTAIVNSMDSTRPQLLAADMGPFLKMLKIGMKHSTVANKMVVGGVVGTEEEGLAIISELLGETETATASNAPRRESVSSSLPVPVSSAHADLKLSPSPPAPSVNVSAMAPFVKMLKMGMKQATVASKMVLGGVAGTEEEGLLIINELLGSSSVTSSASTTKAPQATSQAERLVGASGLATAAAVVSPRRDSLRALDSVRQTTVSVSVSTSADTTISARSAHQSHQSAAAFDVSTMAPFLKMLKMGMKQATVANKMVLGGIAGTEEEGLAIINELLGGTEVVGAGFTPSKPVVGITDAQGSPAQQATSRASIATIPSETTASPLYTTAVSSQSLADVTERDLEKYRKLLKIGMMPKTVAKKMLGDHIVSTEIEAMDLIEALKQP